MHHDAKYYAHVLVPHHHSLVPCGILFGLATSGLTVQRVCLVWLRFTMARGAAISCMLLLCVHNYMQFHNAPAAMADVCLT